MGVFQRYRKFSTGTVDVFGCGLHRIPFHYTGLFINPSGISELDCATTNTDTAERSISIGTETLQVFFLY